MATHAIWIVQCLGYVSRALAKIQQRHASMVTAYIDDIAIARIFERSALNALLRKSLGFSWHERAEKAFLEVKQALMSATALAAPNDTGTFVLYTDASAVAIAGVLHQE